MTAAVSRYARSAPSVTASSQPGQAALEPADRGVERRGSPTMTSHVGVDAELLHHGHEPVEDLRRARAEPARVDVDEPAPAQPLGQPQQEVERAPRRDLLVGVQAGGGHRGPRSARAASQSWISRARVALEARRCRDSPLRTRAASSGEPERALEPGGEVVLPPPEAAGAPRRGGSRWRSRRPRAAPGAARPSVRHLDAGRDLHDPGADEVERLGRRRPRRHGTGPRR